MAIVVLKDNNGKSTPAFADDSSVYVKNPNGSDTPITLADRLNSIPTTDTFVVITREAYYEAASSGSLSDGIVYLVKEN